MPKQTLPKGHQNFAAKPKRSKWSWPHFVSAQGKASAFQSSDGPSSPRRPSNGSQRLPDSQELKTPSQTSLPLSSAASDTNSNKPTNIEDPSVNQAAVDNHISSSPSSSSSRSGSSGDQTIRPEKSQSEQVSKKVRGPLPEESLSRKEESWPGVETSPDHNRSHSENSLIEQSNLEWGSQRVDDFGRKGEVPIEGLNSEEEDISNSQNPPHHRELLRGGSDLGGEALNDHSQRLEHEVPVEKELDHEGNVQIASNFLPGGSLEHRETFNHKEEISRDGDLYPETEFQGVKESKSGLLNSPKDSNPMDKPQGSENSYLVDELQGVDKQSLEDNSQRATSSELAVKPRETSKYASTSLQEDDWSTVNSSNAQSPDLDARIVESHGHEYVGPENPSELKLDLQDAARSSQQSKSFKNQSEPVVVKTIIELPPSAARSIKGRKVQIPKIFIENPNEGQSTNTSNPLPRGSVSTELSQSKSRNSDVFNPTPKVSLSTELSGDEVGGKVIANSTPDITVSTELTQRGAGDETVTGAKSKVSVFKESSQDEPGWPSPSNSKSRPKDPQEKPWRLRFSIVEPSRHSEPVPDPHGKFSEDLESRVIAEESGSDQEPRHTKLKRRNLYIRKARNAAARKVVLEAALGRELAKRTKPALRRLANGEPIALNA